MSAAKEEFVIELDRAKCNHCSERLKLSGGTKGLWTHLETKHPTVYKLQFTCAQDSNFWGS